MKKTYEQRRNALAEELARASRPIADLEKQAKRNELFRQIDDASTFDELEWLEDQVKLHQGGDLLLLDAIDKRREDLVKIAGAGRRRRKEAVHA